MLIEIHKSPRPKFKSGKAKEFVVSVRDTTFSCYAEMTREDLSRFRLNLSRLLDNNRSLSVRLELDVHEEMQDR